MFIRRFWYSFIKIIIARLWSEFLGQRPTHQFSTFCALLPEWFQQSETWTFFSCFNNIWHLRKFLKPKGILKSNEEMFDPFSTHTDHLIHCWQPANTNVFYLSSLKLLQAFATRSVESLIVRSEHTTKAGT